MGAVISVNACRIMVLRRLNIIILFVVFINSLLYVAKFEASYNFLQIMFLSMANNKFDAYVEIILDGLYVV